MNDNDIMILAAMAKQWRWQNNNEKNKKNKNQSQWMMTMITTDIATNNDMAGDMNNTIPIDTKMMADNNNN